MDTVTQETGVGPPLRTPATRLSQISVRFAVGELRLVTLRLPVWEVSGHFLAEPIGVADLVAAHDVNADRSQPTFGRSIVIDEAGRSLLAHPNIRVLAEYPRYYVDLRTVFSDYLARFSSKSRSTLLRKVRKFEAASGGTIDWSTFRAGDDVGVFLREAIPLSRRTYQHRLFKSGLPETPSFQQRLETLAAENLFRAWILRLNGNPVAYICSPAVAGCLQYDYVGFDSAFGGLSPGTVLQYLVLQQLCDERIFEYFDFTEGEGDHKSFFATDKINCGDVIVVGSAMAPRALLKSHAVFTTLARAAVAGLNRSGLKPRIRRLLRR